MSVPALTIAERLEVEEFLYHRKLKWSWVEWSQVALILGVIGFTVWEVAADRRYRWVEILSGILIFALGTVELFEPRYATRTWRRTKPSDIWVSRLSNWWFATRYSILSGFVMGWLGNFFATRRNNDIAHNIAASCYVAGGSLFLVGFALYHRRRIELREGPGRVLERAIDGFHPVSYDAFDSALDALVVGFRSGFRRRCLLTVDEADMIRIVYRDAKVSDVAGGRVPRRDLDLIHSAIRFPLRVLGVQFYTFNGRRRAAIRELKAAARRGRSIPLDIEYRILRDRVLETGATIREVAFAAKEFASIISTNAEAPSVIAAKLGARIASLESELHIRSSWERQSAK